MYTVISVEFWVAQDSHNTQKKDLPITLLLVQHLKRRLKTHSSRSPYCLANLPVVTEGDVSEDPWGFN